MASTKYHRVLSDLNYYLGIQILNISKSKFFIIFESFDKIIKKKKMKLRFLYVDA